MDEVREHSPKLKGDTVTLEYTRQQAQSRPAFIADEDPGRTPGSHAGAQCTALEEEVGRSRANLETSRTFADGRMLEVETAVAAANQARRQQDDELARVLRHAALLGEARAEACREEHEVGALVSMRRPDLRTIAEAAKQEATVAEEIILATEAEIREAREVEARCWQLLAQSQPDHGRHGDGKAASGGQGEGTAGTRSDSTGPEAQAAQPEKSRCSGGEAEAGAGEPGREAQELDHCIMQSLFDAISFGDIWLIQEASTIACALLCRRGVVLCLENSRRRC